MDTGASYTLLHESLWREINPLTNLYPWTLGPLYLANFEAEVPLGWTNVQITLHNKDFPTKVAILTSKALTYSVVLGLDFIFSSGLQINVSDQKYAFKSNLTSILFNPDMPVFPVEDPPTSGKKSTNSTLKPDTFTTQLYSTITISTISLTTINLHG